MTGLEQESLDQHLQTTQREVGSPGEDQTTVQLRRRYPSTPEDVWEAFTDPERLSRWFLPVTGDFRVGGRYQLQGNAGGEILVCDKPRLLRVTWVFGENPTEADITEVEVRLSAVGAEVTELELRHTAVVNKQMWEQYGPGAVGVGWDLTLLGLGMHLAGGSGMSPAEAEAWSQTPAARAFIGDSGRAWGDAFRAFGATDAEAESTTAATIAFYAPPIPE